MPSQLLDTATIRIILQDAQRSGAANGWTGTSGTLAAHITRLMNERAELLQIIREEQGRCSPVGFFGGLVAAIVISIPFWVWAWLACVG